MQFSTATILSLATLIPSLTASPLVPAPTLEKRCVFNAQVIDSWSENALTRYRVAFSSDVTDHGNACSFWNRENNCGTAPTSNFACYDNSAVGSWVVDDSQVAGPAGQSVIDCLTRNFINSVANANGCTTG